MPQIIALDILLSDLDASNWLILIPISWLDMLDSWPSVDICFWSTQALRSFFFFSWHF